MDISDLYNRFLKSKGVITDSRKIEKGVIFFALKGANFNGNEFAKEAIEKGAEIAVIDDPKYQNEKTLLVKDALKTLQNLALYHRKKLHIPVIAITGSNGKTTTKELIAAVLALKFNVLYTEGNLNNHIGVPLTLLRLSDRHQVAVIEMGANHVGEIKQLCSIADPDYGIITNIGKAHIEGFGSFEGVIKAKTEMYDHLAKNGGVIMYNEENELLEEQVKSRKVLNALSYKEIIKENIYKDSTENGFILVKLGTLTIKSNLFGIYNYENIKTAISVALHFNIAFDQIKKGIEKYYPGNNRSQLVETRKNNLILDLYNANPTSMRAAINSFLNTFKKNKLVILGDMLETGSEEFEVHSEIVSIIADNEVDSILVGQRFKSVSNSYKGIKNFNDVNELAVFLKENEVSNKNILIKGSRGIHLEEVIEFL
jgi:UDP-N-acetylmuramoyl-tripeptide--D-alanyl-D-alanine ligase